MRQLLPRTEPDFELFALIDRSDRQPTAGRPWVMANMISSIDGAYAASGFSGKLGGAADRELFHLLRAASDTILVGAGTARVERYGRPSISSDWLGERQRLGLRDENPRLAVISRSLSIPADQPYLRGGGPDPLVIHPRSSDTSGVPQGVELRACGDSEVDLRGALKSLQDDGADVVLCEGGPRLLGDLVYQGLLDEIFVTIAPLLVGGTSTGMLGGVGPLLDRQKIHRLLEADGYLFATYRASDTPNEAAPATG